MYTWSFNWQKQASKSFRVNLLSEYLLVSDGFRLEVFEMNMKHEKGTLTLHPQYKIFHTR